MIFAMDGQFEDHSSSTTTSFDEADGPRLQSSAIDPDLEEHAPSNLLDAETSSRPNLQTEPDTVNGHGLHAAHGANIRNLHPSNQPSFISAPSSDQNFAGHQGTQMAISVEGSSTQSDRALPSREVTESSIEDAFVSFILYCNPLVDLNVSTIELRKGFRAPPRSDGKSFSTFNLFKLIKRLEEKELKTWTQLVIELGVEPPDLNQSTQKVQQYAVRLKVSPFNSLFYSGNCSMESSILALCGSERLINSCTAMAACFPRRCFLPVLFRQGQLILYASTIIRRTSS